MRRAPWWRGERGEWWVIGQGVLLLAMALAPAAWPCSTAPRVIWQTLGGSLILAGLGVAGRGAVELGPNLTPLPEPRPRGFLVRTGLYAHTRHPIYGGLIIAGVGWALWKGSGLHLVLAVALALYMNAKARCEEGRLLARFPEYEDYRRRTKRLIPGVF
ncbi:MAG: isoprenylcysteine carboxylmethyltransferase family protein [Armatimonadota bacterium]|nr:isoprenylcysteine carboxylmethyltransferase family protein [Armatimonadota bacterium]